MSGTTAPLTQKSVLIMAAGTGGHIMPGLAVAREMQGRGWRVSWLGTVTGMENRLVPPSGIPMDVIAFSGLRGKSLLQTALGGLRLLKAFWNCFQIIGRRKPTVVLGMGGYVCFPGGLMGVARNRPLMLVNADAALLLSNKALLPIADRIAFGFEGDAAKGVRGAVVTGNPVRPEVAAVLPPEQRFAGREGPLRLVVVGGSLGAKVLNETVPAALALMPADQRPRVLHQAGEVHAQTVQAAYANAGVDAQVKPFIDDMAGALSACDVLVCRAGAITVSEICAAGVPSILVPLVLSTTSHQRDNATWLAGQGGAIHLPQAELSPQGLASLLGSLTRERLLALAIQARKLAQPNAAARVGDELERLAA
jgi:UDP-N-acetylglucosamine--N-acetylmuramyl-(pentapeptide) pyrophosphoryl-undecaprenol N-acetylglucosamine transferase